jgi:excisionase family DNA binding protein
MAIIPIALKIPEAVAYCGLSRTRLYGLMKSGQLPSFTVGNRRMIYRAHLDDLLAAYAQQ